MSQNTSETTMSKLPIVPMDRLLWLTCQTAWRAMRRQRWCQFHAGYLSIHNFWIRDTNSTQYIKIHNTTEDKNKFKKMPRKSVMFLLKGKSVYFEEELETCIDLLKSLYMQLFTINTFLCAYFLNSTCVVFFDKMDNLKHALFILNN